MAKSRGSAAATGISKGKVTRRKPAPVVDAQRRKDPVFMKNLEAAIAGEFAGAHVSRKAAMLPAASRTAPKQRAEPRAPGDEASSTRGKPSARGKGTSGKNAKSPPRKPKGDAGRKALADELVSLVPELDEEGLAFLVEQARVHLYNMKVQDLEAAAVEAENASARAGRVASVKGGASVVRADGSASSSDFTIQAASDGSAYDLVWQGKWKMFTSDEMLAMVRIASNRDPVAQVGGRLYRWFLAERSDVLQDIPFSGLADPKLKSIVSLLRKTFTVKGGKQR